MKKSILITTLSFLLLVTLSACGEKKAVTDEQMAEKYEMSLKELQETKEAAARMGMSIEDHMKMMGHE
jgi:hypothetical protein